MTAQFPGLTHTLQKSTEIKQVLWVKRSIKILIFCNGQPVRGYYRSDDLNL
jgi:hypothetical protein